MRGRVVAFAAVAVWSVAILAAQTKVTNPDELDKTMKKVNEASRAIGKAAGSNAWGDVRMMLATMKQGVSDAENFWIINKREDAQKITKDVLAKIDAAAKLVATDPADPAAAIAAIKEISPACRQCHMIYRAQDANNNYIIKPGSIGGGGH
jgi:cytochrome c556